MGLFDRFRRKPADAAADNASEAFFLDADKSSTLGDVNFMRRSNTIRRTFPGTINNPGTKERIEEVASMEARLERVSDGLPEAAVEGPASGPLDGGVPKPVKKTFAQTMTQQELADRLKGSAVAPTNQPGGPVRRTAASDTAPSGAPRPAAKPGSIDPFRDMLKDLG
jgi:hypothetical protein